jgi:hypothetical protein
LNAVITSSVFSPLAIAIAALAALLQAEMKSS